MQFASYLNDKEEKTEISSGRDIFRIFQSFLHDGEMEKAVPEHEVASYSWYPEMDPLVQTQR